MVNRNDMCIGVTPLILHAPVHTVFAQTLSHVTEELVLCYTLLS